jgi:hypothetical protein
MGLSKPVAFMAHRKQFGLDLPLILQQRADEVIE